MENNVISVDYPMQETTTTKKEIVKTRRVGTVSIGLCMVVFGVMFLLCSLFEVLSYEMVFSLWPVILITLGAELVIYSFFKGKLYYDKSSVFIMILMLFMAAGLAAVDTCFKLADYFIAHQIWF